MARRGLLFPASPWPAARTEARRIAMDHHGMLTAALNARVAEVLPDPTPITEAPLLSARLGFPVLLKREDLTPISTTKLRTAYHRVALLLDTSKAHGASWGTA